MSAWELRKAVRAAQSTWLRAVSQFGLESAQAQEAHDRLTAAREAWDTYVESLRAECA